jgi:hypothetical protein
MKRIPKAFRIGAHKFTVKMVDEDEMDRVTEDEACYGMFDSDTLTIYLLKPTRKLKRSVVLQTFWHEFSHALLWVMSHKDFSNETVVDAMGHHLKQAHDTFEH